MKDWVILPKCYIKVFKGIKRMPVFQRILQAWIIWYQNDYLWLFMIIFDELFPDFQWSKAVMQHCSWPTASILGSILFSLLHAPTSRPSTCSSSSAHQPLRHKNLQCQSWLQISHNKNVCKRPNYSWKVCCGRSVKNTQLQLEIKKQICKWLGTHSQC